MEQAVEIKWVDSGREPQCPPNPAFPDGIDLDGTLPGEAGCSVRLPYPAKRCGHFVVECKACGSRTIITTAGRPDDPRSVKIVCRADRKAEH